MWIIPMKGKGFEVTARNIAMGDHTELAPTLIANNELYYYEGAEEQ